MTSPASPRRPGRRWPTARPRRCGRPRPGPAAGSAQGCSETTWPGRGRGLGVGADGADHGRARPPGQLSGQRAHRAADTVHEHGLAADGPVGEHRPVRGDARDAHARPHLVADRVREIDGQCLGHHGGLRGGPERPVGLGPYTHTRRPARAGSAPEPTASMTPAPSLCDTIPPNAIGEPSQDCRFFTSPGFAPDMVRRTRISPGPGSAAGSSPTCSTPAAGPCRSYHAAIIVLVCRAAVPPFLASAAPSPSPAGTMEHRAGRISAGQRDLARR